MEEKSKKQWGGRRAGAGRKPSNDGRVHTITVRLSARALEGLERMSREQERSRADIINGWLESQ